MLWLLTDGIFNPVVLFRAGVAVCYLPMVAFSTEVSDQQVVIIPWVYSELRLEISGLLLACYLVDSFRAEVGEQQFVIISRGFIQS